MRVRLRVRVRVRVRMCIGVGEWSLVPRHGQDLTLGTKHDVYGRDQCSCSSASCALLCSGVVQALKLRFHVIQMRTKNANNECDEGTSVVFPLHSVCYSAVALCTKRFPS